jgi:hypothetical protein
MHDIPIDILQEVFKQCFTSHLSPHYAHEFPSYLGHVCSRWRALFFSMRSTFWSRIQIGWSPFGPPGRMRFEEIVAFFLGRCGKSISFTFFLGRRYPYDIGSMFMALIIRSEKWEDVSITFWSKSDLGFLLAVKGRLPLLKKLEIVVVEDEEHGSTGNTMPSKVADAFEDAPLLTHLVLWDAPVCRFKFNWSSLTIVKFAQSSRIPKNILPILRETVNLVELTLQQQFPKDLDSQGGGAGLIHLPYLERLSIAEVAFFAFLKTPSLQRLHIDFYYCGHKNAGMILPFLRRSAVKLCTLFIEQGTAETVKEILQFTPGVNKLVLLRVVDVDDVFKWLAGTGTGTQELQCSSLNILWVYSTPWESEDGYIRALGALHDMLARRNPPGNVRDPSPRKLIVHPEDRTEANLESVCKDRGIQFDFIETLPAPTNTIDYHGLWCS